MAIDWNIKELSSLFCKFSAILSGFVFTSITLLLRRYPEKDEAKKKTIYTCISILSIVFFSMITSCYMFSMAAAYDGEQGIKYLLYVIAGTIFSSSIILMILGLMWLYESYEIEHYKIKTINCIFNISCVFVLIYLIITYLNIFKYRQPQDNNIGLNIVFITLIVVYFLIRKIVYKIDKRMIDEDKIMNLKDLKIYYGYSIILFTILYALLAQDVYHFDQLFSITYILILIYFIFYFIIIVRKSKPPISDNYLKNTQEN